jgi:hypothetical protein
MAVKPGGSRQDTKFAGRYKLPGQRGSLSDHHRFLQLEQFALSSARAISVSFFIQLLHDCIRLCPIAQPDDPVIGQDPYPCSPLAIYHLELVQSPIHSPDDPPRLLIPTHPVLIPSPQFLLCVPCRARLRPLCTQAVSRPKVMGRSITSVEAYHYEVRCLRVHRIS